MYYIEIKSLDPALNLALEECLLSSLPEDHPGYFLLWQNNPSIIVGRHQCTGEVVNASFSTSENLPVIRRMTGGGAVYHDQGNLNFSFIANGSGHLDFVHYMKQVRSALQSIGVNAQISGRNDLEVNGKKISGSGQIVMHGRSLHHGTLLVNMNLDRMALALRVDKSKFKSKGVPSMRARVANIGEFMRGDMRVLKDVLAAHCAARRVNIEPSVLEKAKKIAAKKYSSWEWNYGHSPPCNLEKSMRFPWGEALVRLDIRNGRISSCKLNGDFFNYRPVAELEDRFLGLAFAPDSVELALANVRMSDYFFGCDEKTMRDFFVRGLFS